MIHSATAGSGAPRALHSVTPAGTWGITRSAPADISWTSRSWGSLPSSASREPGTPNGTTTTSTSTADSGNSSPPVQTSAVIGSGRPPIASTQPGSGSHIVIVLAVVMTATLLRPYRAAAEPSSARCHDSGMWSPWSGSAGPMTTTGHGAARRHTRMTGPAPRYGSGLYAARPRTSMSASRAWSSRTRAASPSVISVRTLTLG